MRLSCPSVSQSDSALGPHIPPKNPRLLPNEHQFALFVENNTAFCQETGSHAVTRFRNTWKSFNITDSDVITSVFLADHSECFYCRVARYQMGQNEQSGIEHYQN